MFPSTPKKPVWNIWKAKRPWHLPMDVALPCATQNELNEEDALMLVKNGVQGRRRRRQHALYC